MSTLSSFIFSSLSFDVSLEFIDFIIVNYSIYLLIILYDIIITYMLDS
jgi:hypothetical protein